MWFCELLMTSKSICLEHKNPQLRLPFVSTTNTFRPRSSRRDVKKVSFPRDRSDTHKIKSWYALTRCFDRYISCSKLTSFVGCFWIDSKAKVLDFLGIRVFLYSILFKLLPKCEQGNNDNQILDSFVWIGDFIEMTAL